MITLLAAPGSLRAGATLTLDEAEAHHMRVRRAAAGDVIRLVDGAGTTGRARVIDAGGPRVEVESIEQLPAPVPLVLAVGAGDRDRFGWLVEKAVELGATEIVPVESERTGGVATRLRPNQVERLGRRAAEAMKQCGSAWALQLRPPEPLGALLEAVTQPIRWVGAAEGRPVPGSLALDPAVILIGPEGGWSAEEMEGIGGAGFLPVCFGPHILRFETAALTGAALLQAARRR